MSSSDVNVMLAAALQDWDIPPELQPFIPAFIDIMLTLRKLGSNCQKQTSLPELSAVLQKYKSDLFKLTKVRLSLGGMEDTFAGSFLLTIHQNCHSHIHQNVRFKRTVHGWWPGEDSTRSRFRRDGCEPFDISKLPEAALETHFLSLKPSALPQNLGTIVIDDNHHEEAAPDSDDEQDDDATADAEDSPSAGSDEEDDEDHASEGAPEGAPPRHVSPPHTPRDSDDEFDDLMTPPQPTAEEINVNILSHHIGEEDPNLIPGQVPRPPRLILRLPAAEDPSEHSPSESTSSSSSDSSTSGSSDSPSVSSGRSAAEEISHHLQEDASGDDDEMSVDVPEDTGLPPPHTPLTESQERRQLLKELGDLARKSGRKKSPPPQPKLASTSEVKTRHGRAVVPPQRFQDVAAPSLPVPSKRKRSPSAASEAGSESAAEASDTPSPPPPSPPAKKRKTSSGKARSKVHKHSGSRAGSKNAKRPKDPKLPPAVTHAGEIESRDRDSAYGTDNDDPEPLWSSRPGTNHADDDTPVFWDQNSGFFLVNGLEGIPSGALRNLRGLISTTGGMDLDIKHFVNATAPMRTPGTSQNGLVCFNCVGHPETCVLIRADDDEHLPNSRKCVYCVQKKLACMMNCSSVEFDQLKELCAKWGESSKTGLQRQLSEIAEGRRTVEALITARDQLDGEIARLARLDAERVAKVREACREPRDILRHLTRHDPDFHLSMPTVIQLCSVFGWEFSELPSPLVFGRNDEGVPYLRNDTTGEEMLIPSASDFPTGTPVVS
ncbi:hypothetical protein PQX77_021544 [Marasmius sp. AFHP31]|nr:hypothetical protein PQX77_021544 [Marasmius sp. AFHP31]